MSLSSLNGRPRRIDTDGIADLQLSAQLTLQLAEKSGIEAIQEKARELMEEIANHIPDHANQQNGEHTEIKSLVENPAEVTETLTDPVVIIDEAALQNDITPQKEQVLLSEREQRDARLVAWGERHRIFLGNAFRVQGAITNKYLYLARERISQIIDNPIEGVDPAQIAYRIMNSMTHAFDPEKHGENFHGFYLSVFDRIAEHCKEAASIECAPDKPTFEGSSALLASLSVHTSTIPTTDSPAATEEETAHTLKSRTNSLQSPQRMERNRRLIEWAAENDFTVDGTKPLDAQAFEIQGCMIQHYKIPSATIAKRGLEGRNIRDLHSSQIGKKAMILLATVFDPKEHGGDFWVFAEPLVKAFTQRCLVEKSLKWTPSSWYPEECLKCVESLAASVTEKKENEDENTGTEQVVVIEEQTETDENPVDDHNNSPNDHLQKDEKSGDGAPPESPVSAAALALEAEQTRQSNILVYIRHHVKGAEEVWETGTPEYNAALEAMCKNYQTDAEALAREILESAKEMELNKDALSAAVKDMFMETMGSFNPSIQHITTEQFKSHFIACLPAKIRSAYNARNESPEQAQEKRIINYLKAHIENSEVIATANDAAYTAAVKALKTQAVEQLHQYTFKVLKSNFQVINPKGGAITRALEQLFDERAFPSFDPEDANGDRFRGHFTKFVNNDILEFYNNHKHG